MNKHQFKKVLLLLGTSFLILFLALWLFIPVESIPGYKELKHSLLGRLVVVYPLKNDGCQGKTKPNTVLYVLGGTQTSLIYKFKIVADLYHRGLCKKILLLSGPGMTEYDPLLGRNLTNNEWAVKQLAGRGIKKEDIELLSLEKGFFGTLTEAKGISDIAAKRRYERVILVTSPHHTMGPG